jgi:hypothetical protein
MKKSRRFRGKTKRKRNRGTKKRKGGMNFGSCDIDATLSQYKPGDFIPNVNQMYQNCCSGWKKYMRPKQCKKLQDLNTPKQKWTEYYLGKQKTEKDTVPEIVNETVVLEDPQEEIIDDYRPENDNLNLNLPIWKPDDMEHLTTLKKYQKEAYEKAVGSAKNTTRRALYKYLVLGNYNNILPLYATLRHFENAKDNKIAFKIKTEVFSQPAEPLEIVIQEALFQTEIQIDNFLIVLSYLIRNERKHNNNNIASVIVENEIRKLETNKINYKRGKELTEFLKSTQHMTDSQLLRFEFEKLREIHADNQKFKKF